MKRFVVAAIVPLIASFVIALTPAIPADATSTCGGTSLATGTSGHLMRVPTVLDAHPNEFDCDLGPGSPSVPVMRLQIDLNACHNAGLAVDGSYGPLTMAAVRAEQKSEGLPISEQDGLYGPITIDGGSGGGFPYINQIGSCDFLANR
jgi:peptidoglycan hydrolase-like protein with peptidoglycan-binding domain